MDAAAVKAKFTRLIAAGPTVAVVLASGATVAGTRCQLHAARVASTAGYAADYRGSVLVPAPSAPPAIRSLIRVAGVYYRVIGMETDTAGAGLRIDLGESRAGA